MSIHDKPQKKYGALISVIVGLMRIASTTGPLMEQLIALKGLGATDSARKAAKDVENLSRALCEMYGLDYEEDVAAFVQIDNSPYRKAKSQPTTELFVVKGSDEDNNDN